MTRAEVTAILGTPGDNRTMETEPDAAAPVLKEDYSGTPNAGIAQSLV